MWYTVKLQYYTNKQTSSYREVKKMDEQKKLKSPILEIWRRLQGGKKRKGFLKRPDLLKQNEQIEEKGGK